MQRELDNARAEVTASAAALKELRSQLQAIAARKRSLETEARQTHSKAHFDTVVK